MFISGLEKDDCRRVWLAYHPGARSRPHRTERLDFAARVLQVCWPTSRFFPPCPIRIRCSKPRACRAFPRSRPPTSNPQSTRCSPSTARVSMHCSRAMRRATFPRSCFSAKSSKIASTARGRRFRTCTASRIPKRCARRISPRRKRSSSTRASWDRTASFTRHSTRSPKPAIFMRCRAPRARWSSMSCAISAFPASRSRSRRARASARSRTSTPSFRPSSRTPCSTRPTRGAKRSPTHPRSPAFPNPAARCCARTPKRKTSTAGSSR